MLGAKPGVAPGRGERVRALLTTDDRLHGTDSLAGSAPRALVALRDAVRVAVESGRSGALAELALDHPLVVTFTDGAARLAPAPGGGAVAALCADVLAAVYEAHASGAWTRLKVCGKARAYRRRALADAGTPDTQVP